MSISIQCNDLKIIISQFIFALILWNTYIYRFILEFIASIKFSNWQVWQITNLIFSAVTSWQDRYMTLKVNLVLGTWKYPAIWKLWLWSFLSFMWQKLLSHKSYFPNFFHEFSSDWGDEKETFMGPHNDSTKQIYFEKP